jgi:subtilisin family serine protease
MATDSLLMPHRPPYRAALLIAFLATASLSACGGGGGVSSTPTPSPTPTPAPTPTPTPTPAPTPTPTPTNFDTAEYRRSDGPAYHGAITAYQAGASGAGVTIGIIDSGIATANAEFAGRISSASADFASNGSIEDAGGHGTAVATVLAAARNDSRTLGMAWGATILALRTDKAGTCTSTNADGESGCSHSTDAIALALDHARVSGAKIVNISLGGDAAPSNLLAAVSRASAAGMVIVISAGNDGSAAPDGFAASFANANVGRGQVIIAASVDAQGVHSSFSDGALGYESATLSALGERVLSQDQTGAQFLYSGTSFSAPQIAGAAALLAQAFPNLTGAQIVQLLLSSATDAGAAGPDAVYGAGILNITKAFAPVGSTSLAGSATPLSLTANGALSAPMGDAAAVGSLSAVALDALGRAYGVDLKPTLRSDTPNLSLAPALQIRRQNFSVDSGPISVAMSLAPGRGSAVEARRLMLSPDDAAQARALSGAVTMRMGGGMTVSMGFSEGAGSLAARIDGASEPAFLIAGTTRSTVGFDQAAASGFAMRQVVAPRLALTASAEQGHAFHTRRDLTQAPWENDGHDGYASFGVGAQSWVGPLTFNLGATFMREDGTLLGARFGPSLGTLAGRSLFVDSTVTFDSGGGWRASVAVRQGWTDGGGAHVQTNAWALDGEKRGVIGRNDWLALRLSQPLRVASGGIGLLLPTGYDYATRTPTFTKEQLGLAPRGRQIDGEAVYSQPLGIGWLTTNAYWRKDSGNLAWFPDDFGGAMRFSLEF